MTPIYLDNHATTPVDPRVLEAMLPYLQQSFGNPSSKSHAFGQRALEAVESARPAVAALLGAQKDEIVFTSGATESNNIALLGVTEFVAEPSGDATGKRDHIVSQQTEHPAVLDVLAALGRHGWRTTLLEPDSEGRVSADQVREAVDERTLLVSIMAANNEIGTVQPLAEIGAVCKEHGVLFHTDAAQATGRIALDVEAFGVDLLSISGHKFYAPKGVGALFVRRHGRLVRLRPQAWGGGQERGIRPGTLNVPGIVALGRASELAMAELEEESSRLTRLRGRLLDGLRAAVPELRVNGVPIEDSIDDTFAWPRRLPGNLSVSFPGAEGSSLLASLPDVACSAGSACSTGSTSPSHVLSAIGVSDDVAASTLRLGLGRFTTESEVDSAARQIGAAVGRLQAASRGP